MELPEKTIERLSKYRRCMQNLISVKKNNVFSHELAKMLHITPVQVRRDMMLIGYSGTLRRGYDVRKLLESISAIIDNTEKQNVAIIGIGNLGKAIINYFQGKSTKLVIVAGFDSNPEKSNRLFSGVPCFHIDQLEEIINKQGISIAIITAPGDAAPAIAEKLVKAGIKGILNYTPVSLSVEPHAFLEEYDMISSLEKVAFFTRKKIAGS